jgi:hypothetical protein
MRPGLRTLALAILLFTVGGHISEFFDTCEHTFQTGREADYTVVLTAAVAGSVFLAVTAVRLLHYD